MLEIMDKIKIEQGDRLSEERSKLKMTTTEFIQKIGKGKSTVYNWLNGSSSPESIDLYKMAELGMDINYIITGHKTDEKIVDNFSYIPVYPTEICAGNGIDGMDASPDYFHAVRKDWVASKGFDKKHLFIIKVKGDSMTPILDSGDYVIVNSQSTTPKTGCIFAIRIGNELVAKFIEVHHSGNIVLKSRNNFYSDIVLTEKDLTESGISIVGEIVHASKDLE